MKKTPKEYWVAWVENKETREVYFVGFVPEGSGTVDIEWPEWTEDTYLNNLNNEDGNTYYKYTDEFQYYLSTWLEKKLKKIRLS